MEKAPIHSESAPQAQHSHTAKPNLNLNPAIHEPDEVESGPRNASPGLTQLAVELPAEPVAENNLLMDAMISVELTNGKVEVCSLPLLFHYLWLDKIAAFPRLRPHQAPAWHAFLVQLAALSIVCEHSRTAGNVEGRDRREATVARPDNKPANDNASGYSASGNNTISHTASYGVQPHNWVQRLRLLTSAWPHDEPWMLVTRPIYPAFLQPPVMHGLADYNGEVRTPDALDILVTAKNHDVKRHRLTAAQAEDWIYALVSLQTQEGVMGAGKYGVARMNGGYGNRSYFMWSPSRALPGAAFNRDLTILLSEYAGYLDEAKAIGFDTDPADLKLLLWLYPWTDDEQQLQLKELHPLFVEVCRRVRLVKRISMDNTESIAAVHSSSRTMRVNAARQRGVVADPWMPIQAGETSRALSVTADGFSYRRLTEILFGSPRRNYHLPLLARVRLPETQQLMQLRCSGLCRGQGKTQGLHERVLAVPPHAAYALWQVHEMPDSRGAQNVRNIVWRFVDIVNDIQGKCLRPALISLFQKGPREPDWRKTSSEGLVASYMDNMDRAIEVIFFPCLWEVLFNSDTPSAVAAAEQAWLGQINTLARKILMLAMESTPGTEERRILAGACALNILEGALIKNFPAAEKTETEADVSAG